jgi:NADH:ubiquinone oxidoreductase subunit 3 (subunit A)
MEILLTPPFAFMVYIPVVIGILIIGRLLSGPERRSEMKEGIYASGEKAPTTLAAPGYQPFFLIAFFFAVLHLGMLVIGTGSFSMRSAPYLLGLIVTLIVLLLG